MRIAIASLLGFTALIATACGGPAPGSVEWCKGVQQGTIQASDAEKQQYNIPCISTVLKDAYGQ